MQEIRDEINYVCRDAHDEFEIGSLDAVLDRNLALGGFQSLGLFGWTEVDAKVGLGIFWDGFMTFFLDI